MSYQILSTCWSSRTRPQCQRGLQWKGTAPIKILWNTNAILQNPPTRLNFRLSQHLEVEEKKSWKLLEPILAGLLFVVDPHLLKYINTCTNISNSCGYILMLLNLYKSTLIPTKEMSSSAQSSAIASRFFTIWDFGCVRFYPISSLLDVFIYLRYHCWAKPARTSLSLFVLKKRTAMWSNLLTRPPRTTSVTFD